MLPEIYPQNFFKYLPRKKVKYLLKIQHIPVKSRYRKLECKQTNKKEYGGLVVIQLVKNVKKKKD